MRSVLEAGAYQTIERFEVTSANVVAELESIRILDKGDAHMTLKEEESVSQFNEGLKFDGEVWLWALWSTVAVERWCSSLRSNYFQADNRLDSVERQVRGNPEKANVYKDAINQYVCCSGKGRQLIVARLKLRYLLHHAVFRENKKTTKCSVVFDASAYDEHEVSALQPNLVSVLLRFRTRKVTLMADVEKMFL